MIAVDCPLIAALCRSLPQLVSCWQVLALAESYRATAERAVRLLTERLRRVESSNADQADTLTVAMHECQHWLYRAREGWLRTSHGLEGLHQESSGVEGRLDEGLHQESSGVEGRLDEGLHQESQAELRLISQTPTESEGSLSNQRQSEGSPSNQRPSSPPLLRSEDSLSNQPTTGLLSESEGQDSPLSEGRMEGRPSPHTPETPSIFIRGRSKTSLPV